MGTYSNIPVRTDQPPKPAVVARIANLLIRRLLIGMPMRGWWDGRIAGCEPAPTSSPVRGGIFVKPAPPKKISSSVGAASSADAQEHNVASGQTTARKKRRRAAALQDASRQPGFTGGRGCVLECASPLALLPDMMLGVWNFFDVWILNVEFPVLGSTKVLFA